MLPWSHALLQPPFLPPASWEVRIHPTAAVSYLVRIIRLFWTITVALPLILLSSFDALPILPRHRHWGRPSRFFVPLISNVIWTLTFGLPPGSTNHPFSLGAPLVGDREEQAGGLREAALRLSRTLFFGEDQARGVAKIEVERFVIQPASDRASVGVVRDGFEGKIQRRKVEVEWLWRVTGGEGQEIGSRLARDGEQVVVYFVGGGYISGIPLLGPFASSLLRHAPSNARLLAVSYRLASHHHTAFPAALQDALAAWEYLVVDRGFDPRNITLAGDSAGGGLAWSLASYLPLLDASASVGLCVPGKVALFSPWVDLTLSHPSIEDNLPFDFLNYGQLVVASRCYLSSYVKSPGGFALPSCTDMDHISLLSTSSFHLLGASHPLISPSSLDLFTSNLNDCKLAAHHPPSHLVSHRHASLDLILSSLRCSGVRFHIWSGEGEIFIDEIALLEASLRDAGIPLDSVVEPGGFHVGATLMKAWDGQGWLGKVTGLGVVERRAMGKWGAWMEGGGTREGGGAGWFWKD